MSASLSSGILTINVDSVDSVRSAFIRNDGTNYIVATTSGGAGIAITGGTAAVADVTGLVINGATSTTESFTFEGSNDFSLSGALTTNKIDTLTVGRSLSFGSISIGDNGTTTITSGVSTSGALTIQTNVLSLGANLSSAAADVNLQVRSSSLALAANVTAADDVRLDVRDGITQTAGIITAANLGVRSSGAAVLDRANLISTNIATSVNSLTFNNAAVTALSTGSVAAITNFSGTSGIGATNVATIVTGGALNFTSGGGSTGTNLKAGGVITLGGIIGAGSGTFRAVAVGGINQTGGLLGAGHLSAVNSGAGNISIMGLNLSAGANLAASNSAAGGQVNFDNFFGSAYNIDTVAAGPTGFDAVTGITTNNGDVHLKYGPLTIKQAVNAGTASVRLGTEGGASQTATGVISAANLILRNWNGGTIDLTGAANQVGVLAADGTLNGGSIIRYRDADALTIGAVSAGISGFEAATGIVTTSKDVTIISGPLTINQAINVGTGTLRLVTEGGVSGNTSAVITAAALGVRNTTSGNIDLTAATTSNIASLAAVNQASGGAIKYRDSNALAIGSVAADGTLFAALDGLGTNDGDVTIVSGALSVNQAVGAGSGTVRLAGSGGISQSAAAGIIAAALGIRATTTASFITLTATNNDVGTLAVVDSTAGATLRYLDSSDVTIGTVAADGALFAALDGVTLTNGDFTLVVDGAVSIQRAVAIGAAGDTLLLAAAGSVTQTSTGVVTAGGIGVRTTSGDIDFTGAVNDIAQFAAENTALGGAVKIRETGALSISTMPSDGSFFVGMTGITTNNGDVLLLLGGGLAIDQAVAAGTGTIRGAAGGTITQASAGALTTAALGLRAFGNIDLTTSTANDVGVFAAAQAAGGGKVKYRDVGDFTVGTVAADGALFAALNGIVTTNGGTSTNGAAAATGNDVTLVGGAIAVNQAINAGTATVRITAAGGVSQSAAGTLTAASLGIRNTSAGGVDLTGVAGDQIGTFAAFNGTVGGALNYTPAEVAAIGTVLADGALFAETTGLVRTNAAPLLAVNAGLSAAEGSTSTITAAMLAVTDIDHSAAQLTYQLTAVPAHGVLKRDGVELGVGGTFTQADVAAELVTYTHDSSETAADEFRFTVTDGTATLVEATFAITVFQVSDRPTIDVNSGATLTEQQSVVIGAGLLHAADADNTPEQLVYTLTAAPTSGQLLLDGALLAAGGTFTQADVDGGKLTYAHTADVGVADSLKFTLSDGVNTLDEATFGITITPVNDAPTIAPYTFYLSTSAKIGTVVGAVTSSDADGPGRTYELLGGNGALAINAQNGVITVANQKLLVVGTTTLAVRVTDGGSPSLSAEAAVTLVIRKSNTPPAFSLNDAAGGAVLVKSNKATLLLAESAPGSPTQNGALVGTIGVSDVDEPGASFTVTMTDKSGAFGFDAATGRIVVADASKLNIEKTSSFSLTFKTTDHGLTGLPKGVTTTFTVTIKLVDVNEAPTFAATAAAFRLKENNSARATVGTVKATDPDKTAPNKTLSYSLVSQVDQSGNAVGLFAIADPRSGKITVPAAGALNFEAAQSYVLVVRATDGAGLFTDQVVAVTVVDVNEAPTVALLDAAQNPTTTLTIAENAAAGTLVGYLRITNPDVFRAETFKVSLSDQSGALVAGPYDAATGLVAITVSTDPKKAAKLDFEKFKLGRFALSAVATDSGFISNDGSKQGAKSSAKATFAVQLTDTVGS